MPNLRFTVKYFNFWWLLNVRITFWFATIWLYLRFWSSPFDRSFFNITKKALFLVNRHVLLFLLHNLFFHFWIGKFDLDCYFCRWLFPRFFFVAFWGQFCTVCLFGKRLPQRIFFVTFWLLFLDFLLLGWDNHWRFFFFGLLVRWVIHDCLLR